MSAIIEESTGYASFLICDHKDMVVFYQTGTEIAIYRKTEKTLTISNGITPEVARKFFRRLSLIVLLDMKLPTNYGTED
jgi:hypothetical protein